MARPGLSVILDALTLSERDPEVRALVDAFGGEPVEIRERLIGEPAIRSRRMLFSSGGEIILHDDAVVEVLLHLAPTSDRVGVDLAQWIPGMREDLTLEELKTALGAKERWSGIGIPFFPLSGGFVRADFTDRRGWNEPGNLAALAVTVDQPGLACAPDDDNCPLCSNLLVRSADDTVNVAATTWRLQRATEDGDLAEDPYWVRLADLQPLHASGLMQRVESQSTCASCRRIICFALLRGAPATFGYYCLNDARQHPLENIPPVEQWGDDARVAADRDAMHYIDHRRGLWFLVEKRGDLYLDSRYVVNTMADASALVRLDDAEAAAYRKGGHDYISKLAARIDADGPHREQSPFRNRDLYRGPDADAYRAEVSAAIANHTWLAEQRRR